MVIFSLNINVIALLIIVVGPVLFTKLSCYETINVLTFYFTFFFHASRCVAVTVRPITEHCVITYFRTREKLSWKPPRVKHSKGTHCAYICLTFLGRYKSTYEILTSARAFVCPSLCPVMSPKCVQQPFSSKKNHSGPWRKVSRFLSLCVLQIHRHR